MYACCTSKKKKIDLMIQNPELLRLRLSPQEKYYYTNLFYEHSINEKVSRNKFPTLLGLLGTDIAESFAFRIFDTFSADKKSIRLNEYLKYVDVYHYGDEVERCRVTFKLMDKKGDGQITLEEFEDYLNLIIAAIKKVHPGAADNLLSPKEVKMLFEKIANTEKSTFSFQDFEKVYVEKPELLSWIDYFKNNDEEVLYIINNNLRELLLMFQKFFKEFSKVMRVEDDLRLDEMDNNFEYFNNYFSSAIDAINVFCKAIEKKRKFFVNSAGGFNIRNIFANLTKSFEKDPMKKAQASPEKVKSGRKHTKNVFDFTKISTNTYRGGMIIENTGNEGNEVNIQEDFQNLDSNLIHTDSRIVKEGEEGIFLSKFDSKLINDQFKSLKHNIKHELNAEPSVINEENVDNENDEDPFYEKDRMITKGFNRLNVKMGKKMDNDSGYGEESDYQGNTMTMNKYKSTRKLNFNPMTIEMGKLANKEIVLLPENNNEISKIDDMVKDDFRKKTVHTAKNEAILFDDSFLKLEKIEDEDIKISFRDDAIINSNNNASLSNPVVNKSNDQNEFDKRGATFKLKQESKGGVSPSQTPDDSQNLILKKFTTEVPKQGNTVNNLNITKIVQQFNSHRLNQNEKENEPENIPFFKNITNNINYNNNNIYILNSNQLLKRKMSYLTKEDYNLLTLEVDKYRQIIGKYNTQLLKFFGKIKMFCDTSFQMVKWVEQSYKWVENRYLKDHLKKNLKRSNSFKGKENNAADLRFSVHNIPKTQLKAIKNKSKSNLLKAADYSFKILLNMIMGIQLAVQSTPNLTISENDDLSRYLNSLSYSIQTINWGSKRQETFYIKEYAGIIFNNIRKIYNIDKDTFISSISPQDFITEMMISSSTIIEELCSTGKSGSLFYYTRDGKFILKTISPTEYAFLKKILPNYFKHLCRNKHTLLPKFLGCYQLVKKVKKTKSRVYFVIMQNIFSTNKEIHLRYDLKGSKIGRQVLKENEQIGSNLKGMKLSFALKDLDLENNKHYFFVGGKKSRIIDQLQRDTLFLAQNDIIDYSLLVGIHILELDSAANNKNMLETPLQALKNKYFRTYSPGRLRTQINKNADFNPRITIGTTDINNRCTNFMESHSLDEKRNNFKNIENIELAQDDEKCNISEYSIYNMDIKYSENDSVNDIPDVLGEDRKGCDSFDETFFKDFEDGGIKSLSNNEIYFVGIIDILTEFNSFKKFEYVSKLMCYCSKKMSCIPPNDYMKRFNNYMNDKFIEDDPANGNGNGNGNVNNIVNR